MRCSLAVGTALGFGVVDYAQKKSVFEKCTLGPPGGTDSALFALLKCWLHVRLV